MASSYTNMVAAGVAVYRRTLGLIFPTACKHYPTCSEYCVQAFDTHGLTGGARLTLRRLLRCHPFARGGYDPVPPARS